MAINTYGVGRGHGQVLVAETPEPRRTPSAFDGRCAPAAIDGFRDLPIGRIGDGLLRGHPAGRSLQMPRDGAHARPVRMSSQPAQEADVCVVQRLAASAGALIHGHPSPAA